MKRKGNVMLVFIIQIMIFLLAFIGIVKLSALRSPVDGIFYYPKPVQERAVQLSLTDKKTIRIRAIVFMSLFALDAQPFGRPCAGWASWGYACDYGE